MSEKDSEDKSPGHEGALETDKENTLTEEQVGKDDTHTQEVLEEKSSEDVCAIIEEESNTSQADDVITVEDSGENVLPSKTISDADFYDSVSEEEKQYYEKNSLPQSKLESHDVRCTACWKQVNHHIMNNVVRHPVLGVAICRQCRDFYDGDGSDEAWDKDEEGVDLYCRWCGQGGEVLGCDKCQYVYCKKCITRNLGRKKFSEINDSETWECFSCEPSQIYKQRSLMFSLTKWMSELKQKIKMKNKEKADRKKQELFKKKAEVKKKQKEAVFQAEASKVDNFVDEAFHEAFDTLNIYQKCLQDEQRKWIKIRKSMSAANTATIVRSLRKIFDVTRQNMELLDGTLVQGYEMVYPEENQKKIQVSRGVVDLGSSPSEENTPRKPKNPSVSKKRSRKVSETDDIEVQEIVVNGESVFDNTGDPDGGFDPSQLCSVEITSMERGSSSEPEVKRPKMSSQVRGPLKLSNSMFKKKSKNKSPLKKKRKRKINPEEIPEITLSDDEENTDYVSQSQSDIQEDIIEMEENFNTKAATVEDDSDVSLE